VIDPDAIVAAATEIERLAVTLASQHTDDARAIELVVQATDGRVRALRRAERHCRREILERWPAEDTLVRAFFLLSAARQVAVGDPR
jgi:hypothetical protein